MSNPETAERHHLSATTRLAIATEAFLVSLIIAAPGPSTEAKPQSREQSLIERCQEENPPQPVGLTTDDYLGVQTWGGEVHRELPYERKIPLLQRLISRMREERLRAYETSSERAQRIGAYVNRFAAGMVERANSGDKTYKFYTGGGGAFLDGVFEAGPGEGLEPVADNYEGFGWLWRDVEDGKGKLVKREISDNIYRYRDGKYYAHPHPWILGVYDTNAESTFEDPPVLGLAKCASVPGNSTTQGWRVSYYGFDFGSPNNVQLEPWLDGGATVGEVQLADRRALHFVADRYKPGLER